MKKILITTIIILIAIIIHTENTKIQKNNFLVEETGKINIYFCPENKCDEQIITKINESKKIKCAFYDLTEKKIIEILKQKKAEILIDENNYENYGKAIKGTGLMHNKFCILDDKTIITGSYNPTKNNTNNNNIIFIESKTLAKNYEEEFEEIKNNRKQNTKTKTTKIKYNNQTLQQYFCPEDNCQDKIIKELENANKSIYFLTFTFTDKEIAQIIINKYEQGLEIKGIIEKFQNHKISTYNIINKSGIDINFDTNPKFQHNKIFIIDNTTIITGSYNPTNAANTINDENILILKQKDIAEKYVAYFSNMYSEK
ncbi:hypothetical protein K9L67_01345 [Candidatus Woesearchaeota archaeon]|nr:hypothetical protein [Candidatus Woesearchaeota archaeon]MCF7900849.1 hypothetical protein [Candidatus Woesearchaeota archaeon]MCF8013829.1 hypothetical protein [Candidatus Woesearchaeota archaeon]